MEAFSFSVGGNLSFNHFPMWRYCKKMTKFYQYFEIKNDVINMADDQKKKFTFFKSTLGKDVLCQKSAL